MVSIRATSRFAAQTTPNTQQIEHITTLRETNFLYPTLSFHLMF